MASERKTLEFYTIYMYYTFLDCSCESNRDKLEKNFERNMEDFESYVNEYLDEGWQPLGSPTFSIDWLDLQGKGLAIQALTREKNVDHAIVVEVSPSVIIAEQVKPLRSSLRVCRDQTN